MQSQQKKTYCFSIGLILGLLMENILFICVYALVMSVGYTTASVSSNKWMLDHDFENNLDTSQLLWDKEGISSLLTCVSLCNANPSCRSIFYHPSLKKCLGSQSYKRGHPNGQSVQHGWKYYTKPTQCDLDYTFNKTHGLCYKLYSERRTHFEAMDVCEAEGAKLIIIRNDMEFAIVQQAVEAAGTLTRPFIGLRKTLFNNTIAWKWWNGQEATYLNWDLGQPNNYLGNQDCVTFYFDVGYQNKYNDEQCLNKNSFICQKNI